MDLARYKLGGENMERKEDLQFLRYFNYFCVVEEILHYTAHCCHFSDFDPIFFPKFRDSNEVVQRLIVMLRNSAMRSARGGCVLNSPERNWPGANGATIQRAAVDRGIFDGILWL